MEANSYLFVLGFWLSAVPIAYSMNVKRAPEPRFLLRLYLTSCLRTIPVWGIHNSSNYSMNRMLGVFKYTWILWASATTTNPSGRWKWGERCWTRRRSHSLPGRRERTRRGPAGPQDLCTRTPEAQSAIPQQPAIAAARKETVGCG